MVENRLGICIKKSMKGREQVKRIFTMVLALAMVLSMAVGAYAEPAGTNSSPALLLEVTSDASGTHVAVYLRNGAGITNGHATVSYKANTATLLGVEKTDAYRLCSVNDRTAGTVDFGWVGSNLTQEKTLLLTLHLRTAAENAQAISFYVVSDGIYAGSTAVEVSGDVASLERWTNPYTDITNHWAKEDILIATRAGLVNGMTKTTFGPEGTMTRAMLVTILHRMAGTPDVTTTVRFTDVAKEAYYADAVAWAVKVGVTKGVSATAFQPDAAVTRQEMMTMLYRYAANVDQRDTSKTAKLRTFSDHADVEDWAYDAMSWAVAAQIVEGYPDGTLLPKQETTRAQGATILCRYLGR